MCLRYREHNDDERVRGYTTADCLYYKRTRDPRYREYSEIGHKRANCLVVTCATCGNLRHSAATYT
jgi:hypothetical protein